MQIKAWGVFVTSLCLGVEMVKRTEADRGCSLGSLNMAQYDMTTLTTPSNLSLLNFV